MPQWIVHIGPGKTGTTFLQDVIFGRSDAIHAAGRPNFRRKEYREFFHAVTQEEDEATAASVIRTFVESEEKAAGARTIVLSDETFITHSMWDTVARRLKEIIPEAKIVMTIRNQPAAILSYYSNHGSALMDVPFPYQGRHVALKDWFDFAVRGDRCNFIRAIDYQRLANVFLHHFPEQVHVLLFEDMVANAQSFGSKLSQIIGADILPLMNVTEKVNPRQTQRAKWYRMLRTKFLPGLRFSEALPLGKNLKDLAERFLKRGASINVALTDEQKAVVANKFADSNVSLDRRFGLELARYGYPLSGKHDA